MTEKVRKTKKNNKLSYSDFYKEAEALGESCDDILNDLPVSIVKMKNWKVVWCNHHAERMFDIKNKELNGLKFKDLFKNATEYKKFQKNTRPEKKKSLNTAVKYHLRTGDGGNFKAALALAYGDKTKKRNRNVIATILDLTDSCICKNTEMDICDEKNAGSLKNNDVIEILNDYAIGPVTVENRLNSFDIYDSDLVNRISDGVIIIQDSKIRYANETFTQMIGYDNQELLGRGFIELIEQGAMEQIERSSQEKNELYDSRKSYKSFLLTKNSRQMAVEVDICPIRYEGRNADMLLVKQSADINNITENNSNKLKLHSGIELKAKDEAIFKTRFLANMSDNLKFPINSIIRYTELLLYGMEGPLTEGQRANLNEVVKSGYQLLDMISDILDISYLQHGKLKLDRQMFDLRPVLADIIPRWQHYLDEKGIKLEFTNPTGLPPVYGDENRLRQVISNLFSNAVKYTSAGSVGIVCEDLPDSDFIRIMLWDTGCGVPEEKRGIIFDEFRVVDENALDEYSGTGLGLAVSRYIVEEHGGEIWVEDNPGRGSRFCFTIPKVQTGSKLNISRRGSKSAQGYDNKGGKSAGNDCTGSSRCDGPNTRLCAVIHDNIHWFDEDNKIR